MSRISCVIPDANASTFPLGLGTIAMLLVMDPSSAFKVETSGFGSPSGHKDRYPSPPLGTTVALKTYACAVPGGPQKLPVTFTGGVRVPLNGGPSWRVSMTRQGATA